ncbi:MAG: hypothetical protein GY950_06885 [bacterium]|nr:hypothetical protein [bacterium]
MPKSRYTNSIFVNCPFDGEYIPIFNAILFTVFDCGYLPRCALELDDSSEVRIDKITKIISECKYGIHDISRTELGKDTNLPRFNMPLELGLFLGAKRFGDEKQKKKICLVLDRKPYRYQTFISDIAGQDIRSHTNNDSEAIKIVRNWLRSISRRMTIPGGSEILRRYRLFLSELPILCGKLKLTIDEMTFNDYTSIIPIWLKQNP